jgi:hypothetical protein
MTTLTLNGRTYEVEADPEDRLGHRARDPLDGGDLRRADIAEAGLARAHRLARRRHRRRHGRQRLPLRHLPAHPRGDPRRRPLPRVEGEPDHQGAGRGGGAAQEGAAGRDGVFPEGDLPTTP